MNHLEKMKEDLLLNEQDIQRRMTSHKILMKEYKKLKKQNNKTSDKLNFVYLKTLKFISKPFVSLNQYANYKLCPDPDSAFIKITNDAKAFLALGLNEYSSTQSRDERAIHAAKMVTDICDFMEEYKSLLNETQIQDLDHLSECLDFEVQKFRTFPKHNFLTSKSE